MIIIGNDWLWLIIMFMIDNDWYDWSWLIMIDYGWLWLIMIDYGWLWLIMIDYDARSHVVYDYDWLWFQMKWIIIIIINYRSSDCD